MTEPGQGVATKGEPPPVRRLARWFGSRRGRTVSSAVLLIACMMPVLGSSATGATLPSPGRRATLPSPATADAPPDAKVLHCPAARNPIANRHYAVQFSATVDIPTPVEVTTPGGLLLTIPSLSAKVCGLIEFTCPSTPPCQQTPAQTAVVNPDNVELTVHGKTATLGLAILPLDVVPAATTGGVEGAAPNGGLTLVIQAQVKNTTRQLGVSCDTLVDATLSSLQTGSSPLVGPLDAYPYASAILRVALAIPPGSTAVSPTCPGYLAHQIDQLISMPLTLTLALAYFAVDICVVPRNQCPFPKVL
jgi:hypothetical protein